MAFWWPNSGRCHADTIMAQSVLRWSAKYADSDGDEDDCVDGDGDVALTWLSSCWLAVVITAERFR